MQPSPPPPPPPPRPLSRLAPVLWALLFGSLVCCGMLVVRMMLGGAARFTGLAGNLLLAWIPLGLSLLLRYVDWQPGRRRRLFWLTGLLWFLFFPNCFYIVTDLIHIRKFGSDGVPKWLDMMITAGFGLTGVFLGILALYLVHLVVRERFGYRAGWAFAIVMLALGSFGIYLGRYLRWNSWEVFTRPWKLWGNAARLVDESERVAGFWVTFFFFSLMAYLFVVAMARLHEREA